MSKHTTAMARIRYVGIDLGDRHSQVCGMDSMGQVVVEHRVATNPAALRRLFDCPSVQIALEVGTHSPWVTHLLESLGHQVFVANPRKVRLIYRNDAKSDRVDAEWLARLVRMDRKLLAPIRHRSAAAHNDLALLRSRDALVRARTQLVNHVRATVKVTGQRVGSCSARIFHRKAKQQIPTQLQAVLDPALELIGSLTEQIRGYERLIESVATQRYPVTRLLTQVRGVGTLTAMSFVLTVQDPSRFGRNRDVGAYLGLVPRRNQTGRSDPQMRISKAGDSDVRRLLVQAAHYILGPFGPDSDLKRQGQLLSQRGGKNARKRAIVAVARRLAVLLLSLWKTGEVYEPLRLAHQRLSA